ncbi:MAG: hypothetical protein JO232_22935 [Verrucomicrobia bacterium]|nr:hypothetical protein [Verrucomicrobiota bacterium]
MMVRISWPVYENYSRTILRLECNLVQLAPIVNDINIRPIVTGVVVPMHSHTLKIGAKPARDESLPSLVAARISAGYETLKLF